MPDWMKRIAFYILITCLLLHYTQLVAQDFTIGAGGGLNIPSLIGGGSDNPLNKGNSFKFGTDYEVFGVYTFFHTFSCSLGLDYSQQGGLYQLNYLLVPFLLRQTWRLSPHSDFYLGVGPFGGFLLDANRTISPGALKAPNSFNFGLGAVVGIIHHLNDQGAVFMELGSDYGYVRIQKPASHAKGHMFVDMIKIGYTFTFGVLDAKPSNKRYQKILYKTGMD